MKTVIYRYCNVCRRAAQRFSVAWTDLDEHDLWRGQSDQKSAAVLASENEGTCDQCKAKSRKETS